MRVIQRPDVPGRRGYPFGVTTEDLAAYGYEAEELFLEGEATRYRLAEGATFGGDGRWDAVAVPGTGPFRTRMLVYRPIAPERFNGTVVLHWNNVSAGYDLFQGDTPEILQGGYAFVGVTTQRVGVHGLPGAPRGLRAWDPERYASLSIESDDDSYDIFTQAAQAVGPERDRTVDPLAGLEVQGVIAMGSSQSAARLATYANAIHPLARAVDGFQLCIYFGNGTELEVGDAVLDIVSKPLPASARSRAWGRNRIRDDLDVPVMVVNSELEAIACHPVRQPNTDRFRWWESAGTCHVSRHLVGLRATRYERDFGEPFPMPADVNDVSMVPLYDAALHHLHRWLSGGDEPPTPPLLEFAGDPPTLVRDELGLARGGIRLPQVEAPSAVNSAIPAADDFVSLLHGSSRLLSDDELRARYGDRAAYLRQFRAAAEAAQAAGVLLERDAQRLVADAEASAVLAG